MDTQDQLAQATGEGPGGKACSVIAKTGHSIIELHQQYGKKVVIKKPCDISIESKDERVSGRFRNEVLALKVVSEHNHIAKILAFDPSNLWITLRLEAGKSLDEWRDAESKSTLSTSECAMLWKQMSSALAYLHALNIIHDDVKPDNIMWCRDTQSGVLIDFGAAIVLPLGSYFNLSGTPNYAAPEYLDRRKSEKSDVWGLGITMIFALGYVPLPDGEWILPYALNEERSKHRKDMLAWLTMVETLRLGLLESNPLIADMLHASPSKRIDSHRLSLRFEQRQEHNMEILAAGQSPEDLIGSELAS